MLQSLLVSIFQLGSLQSAASNFDRFKWTNVFNAVGVAFNWSQNTSTSSCEWMNANPCTFDGLRSELDLIKIPADLSQIFLYAVWGNRSSLNGDLLKVATLYCFPQIVCSQYKTVENIVWLWRQMSWKFGHLCSEYDMLDNQYDMMLAKRCNHLFICFFESKFHFAFKVAWLKCPPYTYENWLDKSLCCTETVERVLFVRFCQAPAAFDDYCSIRGTRCFILWQVERSAAKFHNKNLPNFLRISN